MSQRGKLLVPDHVKRAVVGAPRRLEAHEVRAIAAMHQDVWRPVMLAACPSIRIRLPVRQIVQWHLFSRGYLKAPNQRPKPEAGQRASKL